jgi:hypothetical protein
MLQFEKGLRKNLHATFCAKRFPYVKYLTFLWGVIVIVTLHIFIFEVQEIGTRIAFIIRWN